MKWYNCCLARITLMFGSFFVVVSIVCAQAPIVGIDSSGADNHGESITVDLPVDLHRRNTSSKGLGNCVFTSIHHCSIYHSVPQLQEFPQWLIDNGIAGGGWPDKVTGLITKISADRKMAAPEYVQNTTGDVEFLKLALKTGRFVGVTYAGHDGVYYNGMIGHMVNLVHLSDSWAVILDNNNPGKYLWMTPAEFLQRWREQGGGWAFVLLSPPPTPVPVNVSPKALAGQ